MKNNLLLEQIRENKETIMWILIAAIFILSLSTIGWVIYRFFFWEPYVDPFIINFTNLSE